MIILLSVITISEAGIVIISPALFVSTSPPLIDTLNISFAVCSIVNISFSKLTITLLPGVVFTYIAEFSRLSVRFTLNGFSDVDVEPSIILILSMFDANCGNGKASIGIYKSDSTPSIDVILYLVIIELIFDFTLSRFSSSVALLILSITIFTYVLSN